MTKLIILSILLVVATNLVSTQDLHANQLHQIHTRHMAVSRNCSFRGYLYGGRCYCIEGFKGRNCSENSFQGFDDNNSTKCDDLTSRLDHLNNISPEFGTFDDNEFSRFKNTTIGAGQAAYGDKGSSWIPMHSVSQNFSIFNKQKKIKPQDIGQGALGNCYFLAALASLANIRNGQPITDAFDTQDDNANRTYVAKFFLDGKIRYVGVDDWVPGSGSRPSFSKPVNNNQFWVMILEKVWAKIHGSYMITEGGWQTNVWKAITQAPIDQAYHSNYNATSLFQLLSQLLKNQWAVGSATVSNTKKDLVQGHAYSVLGTYNFTNENGTRILLVKVYNPWHSENNYPTNPWRDNSSLWTNVSKNATTYNEDNMPGNSFNDGIFYLTHQDYYDQFGITNWAEIYEGYGVNFQEIPIQTSTQDRTYSARFNYTGNPQKPFYVSVEIIDSRLLQGCSSPFQVLSLLVTLPDNKTVVYGRQEGWESVRTVKISGDQIRNGTYKVDVIIRGVQNYHKFITVSTYSELNRIQFAPRSPNDTYIETFTKLCPKNCSRHGICNTFTGVCQCDFAWNTTADCSVKTAPKCLNNCNGKGICLDGNTCQCQKMYMGEDCQPCTDAKGTTNCKYWQGLGYFDSVKYPQYKAFIEQSCALTAQIGNCKP